VASVVLRIDRAELVRMAALEAARGLLASLLKADRARRLALTFQLEHGEAIQSLRDCLAAERKVR
jgi:hypothetical protein